MNKKSKQRAFFVYVIICILYVFVAFRLSEKLSMTRISSQESVAAVATTLPLRETGSVKKALQPQGAPSCTAAPRAPAESVDDEMGPAVTTAPAPVADTPSAGAAKSGIEPSLLISIPVVCYAIREGWLEKESLIFAKKDAYNNVSWRKPLEILKDHDEEGVRNILNTIGTKRALEFMSKEGLGTGLKLNAEDLILGKGYTIERAKLIALYDKYVTNTCDGIFPFSTNEAGMAKGASGFQLTVGKEKSGDAAKSAEAQWMMPNLANLPIRMAIGKLSAHTSRIKVYGNGRVVNQSPKAFERLDGESECVIHGRAQNG